MVYLVAFGKPAGQREVSQGSLMCTLGGSRREKQKRREEERTEEEEEEEEEEKTKTEQ